MANRYVVEHKDGRTFTGTTRELSEITGSHPPWELVAGQFAQYKPVLQANGYTL